MQPRDFQKWSDVLEELEGYRNWVNEIDAKYAMQERCPICMGPMEYEGFQKDGSRKSYAVCRDCSIAMEF